MNFKKVILITAFLSVVLFWCAPAVRAQTLEELSTQIATIRNQIVNYQNEIAVLQKKISNLQAEMARLLTQQISIVQNQIAQLQTELQTKTLAKPESEYKCPDLNRDGIVDLYDTIIISSRLNTCQGAANYDARGDVDGNNCLTNTDLNFVNKNYGKKTNEIEQCKGIIIPLRSPKPESEYKCPDLNGDGTVNLYDAVIISAKINSCEGNINYDARGDIDGDGCLTEDDANFVTKHYGKKIQEISPQCVTPIKPPDESEYKCPDLNRDGIVDLYDTIIISARLNTCQGAANYDPRGDVDRNGCLTTIDLNFVQKYYGKKTTEITQCEGVAITPSLLVSLSANPSFGNAPLTGVDLIASVSGTATGLINYTLYCNRSDSGTNIASGWCQKKDGLSQISYSAIDCCNFYSAGTYTAKIVIERAGQQAEARKTISVNPPLPSSTKTESEYKCPDLNGDGIVDLYDTIIISARLNTCQGAANYDPRGDVDKDGCLTSNDLNFVQKYYGKNSSEIVQCKGVIIPPVPESQYRCPDLNNDGKVDVFDAVTVNSALNACKGDAKYEERIDVDKDNCITTNDSNFVNKNYGKKAADIPQCAGVSVLDIESMMASIADAISKIAEEIGKLIR